MQLERGAIGVTVAKVGEAEVFADAGFNDILWRIQYSGRRNFDASLISRATAISWFLLIRTLPPKNFHALPLPKEAIIGVLVEFDSGAQRCGLAPGAACVELARKIKKMAGLEFRGLMTHFGNVWGSLEERRAETQRLADRVARRSMLFRKARMPVKSFLAARPLPLSLRT